MSDKRTWYERDLTSAQDYVEKNKPSKEELNVALRSSEDPKITKFLLEQGAAPNAGGTIYSRTALHWTRDVESAKLLLAYGANPNVRDSSSLTPLHTVGRLDPQKATEIVKVLLEAGANPNAYDGNRNTPLHIHSNNPDAVKILLGYGANPNLTNREGYLYTTRPDETAIRLENIHRKETKDFFEQGIMPCLLLGLMIFMFSKILIVKLKNKHAKMILLALGTLGVFLNPLIFHPLIFLINFLYDYLYFIPGSKKAILAFSIISSSVLCNGIFIWKSWKKKPSPSSTFKKTLQDYLTSHLPYLSLLPYYCLLGVAFYEKSGDATGDFVVFFGIPYLILFGFLSALKRQSLYATLSKESVRSSLESI